MMMIIITCIIHISLAPQPLAPGRADLQAIRTSVLSVALKWVS